VDSSGNVTVTGEFQGTADFGKGPLTSAGDSDVFVASYDAAGNARWAERFGAGGTDRGYSVAVDSWGNLAVIGQFSYTVDFGTGPLTSAGNLDAFVFFRTP